MSEDRLRKVLGTMDDIEPPRDDLFAQRALMRGRARTARRRGAVFGAAAGLVVAASLGGVWVTQHSGDSATTSAASAPELAPQSTGGSGSGGAAAEPGPTTPGDLAGGGGEAPGVSAAREGSTWFTGPVTVQRAAFESIESMLERDHSDVFSGAYAASPANTRIVVALTRRDPQLEATIASVFPDPADVSFTVAANSVGAKRAVMERVRQDTAEWAASGITLRSVELDGRSDRVVVTARPASGDPAALDAITQRYGAGLVQVVPDLTPTGKRPDGSTFPPPQR